MVTNNFTATPDLIGVKPLAHPAKFYDSQHHVSEFLVDQSQQTTTSLSLIPEEISRVEKRNCPMSKAIALLARESGITQAKIWHLRSLWVEGVA